VFAVGDVVADLERVAAETGARPVVADVRDPGHAQRLVDLALDEHGRLDVVVANAGIAARGATFRAQTTENFERVLDVDLYGVYRTVDAALPEIVARKGHVVVIASIYAFVNGIGTVAYAMAKAGVEQLGRALRVELAQHGASASVAYFGFIDTEMVHRGIDQDPLAERMMAQTPKVLRKRLAPAVAGEAIARGIERRAPRIIRPRRWTAYSVLRGVINPLLDKQMERDAETQAILRELDARGSEEQPTTA
jgi:NAD(P)-dependent dehydrogenase (short-subunit alcohol dehydrogenase family)